MWSPWPPAPDGPGSATHGSAAAAAPRSTGSSRPPGTPPRRPPPARSSARRRCRTASGSRSCVPTPSRREDLRRDRNAQLGQALHESRTDAGGLELAAELALVVDPGAVVEQEQVLKGDDLALHAR